MARRVGVRELESLPWPERLKRLRHPESQTEFADRTGFSVRQVKRWEKGSYPTERSALDLEQATGYPARLFLPPPEPTLGEIGQKLDLIIAMLEPRNGRRR